MKAVDVIYTQENFVGKTAISNEEIADTLDHVAELLELEGEQQQGTVVTAERGPLAGKRVIRGRERECRQHYGL